MERGQAPALLCWAEPHVRPCGYRRAGQGAGQMLLSATPSPAARTRSQMAWVPECCLPCSRPSPAFPEEGTGWGLGARGLGSGFPWPGVRPLGGGQCRHRSPGLLARALPTLPRSHVAGAAAWCPRSVLTCLVRPIALGPALPALAGDSSQPGPPLGMPPGHRAEGTLVPAHRSWLPRPEAGRPHCGRRRLLVLTGLSVGCAPFSLLGHLSHWLSAWPMTSFPLIPLERPRLQTQRPGVRAAPCESGEGDPISPTPLMGWARASPLRHQHQTPTSCTLF